MIEKGTISTIKDGGKKATAVPSFSDSPVSAELTVPFYLVGCLEVGMQIVYAHFPDGTGVVLGRMDGEWNHDLEGDVNIQGDHTVGGDQEITGKVTSADLTTPAASFNSHIHGTPAGDSTAPK